MGRKICHFSSVHRVNDIRVFHKECKSLAETGNSVTLVACEADVTPSEVTVIKLKRMGWRPLRMFTGAFRAYHTARLQHADIYHFHDPELLPYGFWLKKTTRAKVIYDSHECYPEDILSKEWIPLFLRKTIASTFRLLEDFVARRLDLVIAATSHIESRFTGIAKRTITINNYPLRDEFGASDIGGNIKRDGFCYVGAISQVRGILPLMDSLDFIAPEVKFHLAGTFANPDTEQAVKSHRNWNRVSFYGQVSRKDISDIYKKSFAGIVNFLPAPNHTFSQPNKLFEYMSAGIPVICSNFDLWQSVVETGRSGICVDPTSARDIGSAVMEIHNNPALWKEYSSNGLNLIQTKYSWDAEAVKLRDAYDQVSAHE